MENKLKYIESENAKLRLDIDVFENKIKGIEREKQDFIVRLEFFTLSEERRKKKKKLNESYEDVLGEQFDNMKKGFVEELEKSRKEISVLKLEQRKVIFKYEMEANDLKHRNSLYYKQLEDLRIKLNL